MLFHPGLGPGLTANSSGNTSKKSNALAVGVASADTQVDCERLYIIFVFGRLESSTLMNKNKGYVNASDGNFSFLIS